MIRNYFHIALRILLRHKAFSLINILSLSVGIAACVLIVLFVQDERSYDHYHSRSSDIYRVVTNGNYTGLQLETPKTPAALGPVMLRDIDEVENMTRLVQGSNKLVSYGDKQFTEKRFYYADSSFFDIFSFRILRYDSLPLLNKANTVVLTQSTARRYFGDEDPMGKVINLDNGYDYRVTGICEDVPENSHFHFDFVASIATYKDFYSNPDQWFALTNYTYFLTRPGTDPDSVENALHRIIDEYISPRLFEFLDISVQEWDDEDQSYEYTVQSLTSIHLRSNLDNELETNGDLASVFIFSIIAIFLLVIACINFMNLSTARYAKRAKEVGIRKVLGSSGSQLIWQFLIESIFLSFLALILGLALVEFILPAFNDFTAKDLGLGLFKAWHKIPLLFALGIFVGLMAGSYPALFLASLKPVSIFRGTYRKGSRSSRLRNLLVVSQFTISIMLFIGTGTIYQQMQYIRSKKLGFDKENVLVMQRGYALKGKYTEFKDNLLRFPGVVAVSAANAYPGQKEFMGISIRESDSSNAKFYTMRAIPCDKDFDKVLKLSFHEGRMFNPANPEDTFSAVITASAVALMGLENPIGKILVMPTGKKKEYDWKLPIRGVLDDFHAESLREEIKPVILLPLWENEHVYYFMIRVKSDNLTGTIEDIQATWREYVSDQPFEYFWLDEKIAELYADDARLGTLGTFFSLLAILIASLGLLGLASFTAEQRTREIGIRKVLGASVLRIIFTLSSEFSKWILIAILIAWPLSWYLMGLWLEQFTYHVSLNPLIFIAASGLAFGIALITVIYEAYMAATANPVNSLKYE